MDKLWTINVDNRVMVYSNYKSARLAQAFHNESGVITVLDPIERNIEDLLQDSQCND